MIFREVTYQAIVFRILASLIIGGIIGGIIRTADSVDKTLFQRLLRCVNLHCLMLCAELRAGSPTACGHVLKHAITQAYQVLRLRQNLIHRTAYTGRRLVEHDGCPAMRLAHVTALQYVAGHALCRTHHHSRGSHAAIAQAITDGEAIVAIAAEAVDAHR